MELQRIVDLLSRKRQVFYSEADFQFALAWEIQQFYPDAEIRLEYPATMERKEYIDILVRYKGNIYPIELKYKTRKISLYINKEHYNLKNHGAGDFGSYDFVKDICRLENFLSSLDGCNHGFALWLTNDSYYWNPPRRDNTGAAEFRVYDGAIKSGTLTWGNAMTNTHALVLNNEYVISWSDYSKFDVKSAGIFKYALINVQ